MAERGSTSNMEIGVGLAPAAGDSVSSSNYGRYSTTLIVVRDDAGPTHKSSDPAFIIGPRLSDSESAVAAYPYPFTLPVPTGGGGGGGVVLTAKYVMRGRDVDAATLTYRFWRVTGSADMSGAFYTGPKSGASPLADIIIYQVQYS